MSSLVQDIRLALRQLRKAPSFTATALLTLALGVGANTAVFTLVHAVMLKSLPISDPARLYRIGNNDNCCVWGGLQDDWGLFSYDLYKQFRDNTPAFQQVAAMQSWGWVRFSIRAANSEAPAESYHGEWVSGNYFSTLGINALMGRAITAKDDSEGAPLVTVMSYRAWQEHFGGKSSIIGSSLFINGKPFTVVGVAPPGFFGDRITSDPPDLWIPLASEPVIRGDRALLHEKRPNWLYLIGRMSPDAAPGAVEAQLNTELRQYLASAPFLNANERLKIPQQTVRLGPGGGGIANLKVQFQQGLYLLTAASALLLLIACANLANLLLARAAARRQQISIQLALGASRARLIRGTLTEAVLLALLGGIAGLAVAYTGARAMLLIVFGSQSFVPINTTPSLAVLAFTFGISALTGVFFGVVPAWLVSRANPVEALRGAGRSTRDHSAFPQRAMVVVQAALSLVLLAAAGLVTQSLRNLQNQNFFFETRNRYIAFFDPELAGYTTTRLPGLYDELQRRLLQLPGVRTAAYAMYVPQGHDNWSEGVFVEGHNSEPGKEPGSSWERISPHYFDAIGTPVVRGRPIGEQDTATSTRVAVVNEAFVRKIFPNEDPMGRHFGKNDPTHQGDYQIVGVVADAKYQDPASPARPIFFVPFTQTVEYKNPADRQVEQNSMFAHQIVIQAASVSGLEEQVRRTLAAIDPNLSLLQFRTYDDQVRTSFRQQILLSDLTGVFAIIALLLASVGLYGVTAYRVARRTSEIGIRMALGATPGSVVALVLRSAFSQIGIGLVIGIPLAIGAGRAMGSKLYGVHGYDPLVLGAAVLVLGLAALVASVAPARTAAAIQPMQALRMD